MSPKLFDTHTHFNFNAFKDDSKEAMQRSLDEDVWFVNVGAERKTSLRAVKMAEEYEMGVYASVGLHPIHTFEDEFEEEVKGEKVKFITQAEEFDRDFYADLIDNSPKIVAIGETGLDYFHLKKFAASQQKKLRKKQQAVFCAQVDLAIEKKKPVILHCRALKDYDAYFDMLDIVKDRKKKNPELSGVLHCFSGNLKIAEAFADLDFYFGFNGVITFARDYDEVVKILPLDKILLETDSPWLTPVPYRGRRNESIYVSEVAKKIAELRNVSFEEIALVTTQNAMRLFGIEG